MARHATRDVSVEGHQDPSSIGTDDLRNDAGVRSVEGRSYGVQIVDPAALLLQCQITWPRTSTAGVGEPPDHPWGDRRKGSGPFSGLAMPGSPAVAGGEQVRAKEVTVVAICEHRCVTQPPDFQQVYVLPPEISVSCRGRDRRPASTAIDRAFDDRARRATGRALAEHPTGERGQPGGIDPPRRNCSDLGLEAGNRQ